MAGGSAAPVPRDMSRDTRSGRTRGWGGCPLSHPGPPAPIPAGLAALAPTRSSAPRLAPRPAAGTQRGEAVPRAGIRLRPGLGRASQEGFQRGGSSPLAGGPSWEKCRGGFVGLTLLRDPAHTQTRGAEPDLAAPAVASPPRVPPAPPAAEGDRAEVIELGVGQEQGGDRSARPQSRRFLSHPPPGERSPHSHAAREASQGTLCEPGHPGAQGHPGDTQPIPPGRRTQPGSPIQPHFRDSPSTVPSAAPPPAIPMVPTAGPG